jgi:hypothetical protein
MRKAESRVECALFDAYAGLWKQEAIKEIKQWILQRTEGVGYIGIVG